MVCKTDLGREIMCLLQVHLASSVGCVAMGYRPQYVTTSIVKTEVENQRAQLILDME